MRPLLHIPDGFLAPQVALALWVATAVVIGIALRRIGQRGPAAASQTILMGLSGAFIFAAQMFNFPVAAGTSGHLLGGVLAAGKIEDRRRDKRPLLTDCVEKVLLEAAQGS